MFNISCPLISVHELTNGCTIKYPAYTLTLLHATDCLQRVRNVRSQIFVLFDLCSGNLQLFSLQIRDKSTHPLVTRLMYLSTLYYFFTFYWYFWHKNKKKLNLVVRGYIGYTIWRLVDTLKFFQFFYTFLLYFRIVALSMFTGVHKL